MNTETMNRISQGARVGADLLDQAVALGMPEPYSIAATRDGVRFGFSDLDSVAAFHKVAAWAAWLGIETRVYVEDFMPEVEFIEAFTEVDGVRVKIGSNRPI